MNAETVPAQVKPVSNSLRFARFLSDLKRRRNKGGLSQNEVAETMGVSYQSVNRWENSSFTNATVSNLLAYLNVLEANNISTRID